MKGGRGYSSEADLSSPRKEVLGESEEEREGRGGRRWKPDAEEGGFCSFRVFFSEEGKREFSFPRREGASRLLRRRVASSSFFYLRRRGPPIPVFLAGIQPFSVFLEGNRVFSFPRREGSRFSRGMRRRVSYFFLFRGRDPTCFFSIGSGSFRTRRGAFPRATALSTSPGRTSEIEGIQLPGSSRSPVDQRFFRKRTDSCFPLFLFSSNRSNLSLVSTNRSNLSLVS